MPGPMADGARQAATTRSLFSYSHLREARPMEICEARDAGAIAAVLGRAERDRRRVTVRAGGRSFDDQAINDDIVLRLAGFDRIHDLDEARAEITVEAATPWCAIVDATVARGFIPHILVTTAGATAGGTLSANCLSRSSAKYGHTGDHVRSLELLTVGGDMLTCSRRENTELFRAVIGGFGYFGVVTEVTYDLLHIGARRRVRTLIDRREGLDAYIERLTDLSLHPDGCDAVYSVFSLAEPQRGAVFRSMYTDEPLGKTLFLHHPHAWYRPFAELFFLSGRVGNALCHASYKYVFGGAPFVDDLRGYTFCMEGNERMKAMAARARIPMRSLQPSYAVPAESILFFFRECARLLRHFGVYPSLLDCLFRPADDYLLSSANDLAGFCTSFLFEGVTHGKFQRLRRCIHEMNEACIAAGGRTHLVKNVYATKSQLQRMYAHALPKLASLKSEYDPRGVLVNDFFMRAFG